MKRPSVNTRCVASRYQSDGERIVEFSSDCGGDCGRVRAPAHGMPAGAIQENAPGPARSYHRRPRRPPGRWMHRIAIHFSNQSNEVAT